MYQDTYKLVPVEIPPQQYQQTLVHLWTVHNSRLANIMHARSLPKHIIAQMKALDENARVIAFNRLLNRGHYSTLMARQMFPFCSVHKNGLGITVLQTDEALRKINYFLCLQRHEVRIKRKGSDLPDRSLIGCPQGSVGEYSFHTSVESTRIWRDNPAYVNLDRTSDSIGGSSWDGNIVSWFRAGFQSRVRYADQAGILPDD